MWWTAGRQASLSFPISWSLLQRMYVELVMPSNHLILCHPFFFCPQSFLASGSFPMSRLLRPGNNTAPADTPPRSTAEHPQMTAKEAYSLDNTLPLARQELPRNTGPKPCPHTTVPTPPSTPIPNRPSSRSQPAWSQGPSLAPADYFKIRASQL